MEPILDTHNMEAGNLRTSQTGNRCFAYCRQLEGVNLLKQPRFPQRGMTGVP
ncbi:MAG: hypothetical protein ACI9BW_001035 [Gammaproteobacteria bacterium]|jgi:hypothetical protein